MDRLLDRNNFARLAVELRPRLHRYCARMVGSAFDGEDVVQDALAHAMEALPMAGKIENPEGWLLRIAHNAALDLLRRRKRRGIADTDDALSDVTDQNSESDARVAATANLGTFMYLPTVQRSSVLLSDVLGYSLSEIADLLDISLAAVKAALHRGRGKLRELVESFEEAMPRLPDADRVRLHAYADRFNARDFDALRDLLSEDVRLELVNRLRLKGRKDVSTYFTRYGENPNWRVMPGSSEGRPALLVSDPTVAVNGVAYVIVLDWIGDEISAIRDFRYAPYVMEGLIVERL
ncbi:MAG TPA: sigma-70 family RNA polymerase sigma factor [Xanthobacteraceae bacterium]|nr:sigma-70 family RNA polymerase sigma factor [Xanthobacteraceae bacterium]